MVLPEFVMGEVGPVQWSLKDFIKSPSCFMSIEIRFATVSDAENISAIGRQTFFETFALENTKENMEKHLAEYYAP